jgi:hypothetical protein
MDAQPSGASPEDDGRTPDGDDAAGQ